MLNAARVLRLCSIVLSIGVAAQVLAATHDAGTTPGSFDVDQSGAASYSIPIQVPPGIGGVQPSLSLNYSSQGGNGLLGMGWSLGGLSAITRCPTNLYDDGYIHGVDYSAQDKFCLDGQRLVAISGAYGASGTEYRTQNESYSKIISYGTVGTGPAYFVVRTKSGQMMEYGNTVDSFVEAQGKTTALMWAVNKISDMTGNYIKFSYTDNSFATGEHYINRIDYTGNATTGLAPYFSVCFVYDNDPNTSPANCTNAGTAIRSDIITQYESGSITKVTHRLSHIQTIVGINKIKEYRLTYDSSGAVNNSHLISVTDCGSDGVCISPTTFTWSQTTTGFDPPQMLLTSNGGVNGSPTSYLPGYMFVADFNGDGRADYMWNYGGWQVATTTGELPDLLVKTTNGLGDTTSVSYKPLTDSTVYQIKVGTETCVDTYPIPCVQASIQVVSSYAKDNGKGGQYLHNYFYTGLKAHSRGRGVLGFHDIIITDPQTGVQIQTVYHQYDAARLETDPLKYTLSGRVDTQTTYKGGSLLAVTDNTWTPKLSPLYAGVSLVELSRADEYSYELNIPGNLAITHTTTTTTFDNDGNATSIVVNSNDGYVKTTTNTYPPADYVNWILGRLTSASVLSQTPTQSQTRSSSFTYFSNGLLQSETIQPGNAALAQTTTYVYDSYGNKSSVTVSGNAGSADPTYSTFAPVSYTTSNAYNYANLSVDGTYTVATTNPKLHTETKTIDARFGVPIKRVGPNGLATTWSYDALGRAIHETRADTSYTQTDYVICELAAACADPLMNTLHSPMKVVRTESTGATGSVYYDTLGREILKSTVGFDGRSVYVATEYDSLGHVLRVSNPVFDTALLNTLPVDACSPTHLLSLWTQNGYDAIGRMRCEYHPDGSHTEVHYLGLQTDTVNDKGQTGSKFKNSQGQLVQSTDATGHYNSYSYDAFGNLLSVTDAAGNTTSMSYDIRGNKIGMVDPDMGNWAYRYDAFGQLRWQQDAKAQIVTMDYDNLGRMFTRTELEGTTSWTYDTAINGKGKLQQVTGPGGYKQVFTYDALGRASTVATTIKGNTYSVASSYLAGSSLVDTVTYPYSLVIQNLYNGRGQLAAVKRSGVANACTSNANYEYWRANAVNAAGQVIKETLCNNITTVRLYDDYTGRVEGISSGVGASTAVQNLTFDYDTLGNLITRKDNNKAYAEAFQYDTLNRLTRSDLTTPTLVKTTTYQYDAIGNIQYKSDVGSYLYSKINAGPHAVTTAGTATYSYDKNGNQAAGDGRTLTYTSFNKPKTVVRGATTENVEYGAAHERVYKNTVVSTASTRTYYLGAFEEVILPSGISERKYYIAAGGTTVLITNRSNSLNDTRYLHKDHLGSTDAITTETGALLT
ncbi:MAG: hypothetical protein HY080_13955, partial [Gammaproteobacteria bacterium]|nr:hypothetical protein [Gammaproteobacteria bacterium]